MFSMLFERRLQGRIKDELKIEGILNRQRQITIPMVGTLGAKEFARMQTLRNNTRKELDMKNTT